MKRTIIALFLISVGVHAMPTVAIGDIVLSVTASNTAVLNLQLQKTTNLNSGVWEDSGDPVRWEVPMANSEFFRVQAIGEEIMAYTLTYTSIDPSTTSLTGYTGTPVDVVVPEIADGGRTVVSLGNNCFKNDLTLETIQFPNTIASLGIGCFQNCSSLVSIDLPDSITSLGAGCFADCESLASIDLSESITSLGNFCFTENVSLVLIDLPDSITSLGDYCFENCSSLASVNMSDSVTSLGLSCFVNCSSLVSIDLPESVTSLGTYCFRYCESLATITMGGNAPTLGTNVFQGVPGIVYYPATATGYTNPWGGLEALPYSNHLAGILFDNSITIGGTQFGKWLITEGTGTTATDDSGQGNDGTITDGTWVISIN